MNMYDLERTSDWLEPPSIGGGSVRTAFFRTLKNLKCDCCEKNCSSCEEEDYETKYNELVNRIKNTSKNQLQKLKNEL